MKLSWHFSSFYWGNDVINSGINNIFYTFDFISQIDTSFEDRFKVSHVKCPSFSTFNEKISLLGFVSIGIVCCNSQMVSPSSCLIVTDTIHSPEKINCNSFLPFFERTSFASPIVSSYPNHIHLYLSPFWMGSFLFSANRWGFKLR